jgi:capsular polysaccharide biosynthesis protein
MNEDNNRNINPYEEEEESSIDFGAIFAALKKQIRLYLIIVPIFCVLGVAYALNQVNYYTSTVMLAPEASTGGASSMGGLASLAKRFGVSGRSSSSAQDVDAILPDLYPDLINSVDFKTKLFEVNVHHKDKNDNMPYYNYLLKYQKRGWIGELFGGPMDTIKVEPVNPFELTKKQDNIAKAIDKNVVCDVDSKTGVITITVTDQDAYIAACMADSVRGRLQRFITDYRTAKARRDLAYQMKLYKEAKRKYIDVRQKYIAYSDANQDIVLESVRSKLEDLENDMQLKYNSLTSLDQAVEAAQAKVQEFTPAFTTLQSATVPVKKAGPSRAKTCAVFLLVGILLATGIALYKEDQIKPLLGLN